MLSTQRIAVGMVISRRWTIYEVTYVFEQLSYTWIYCIGRSSHSALARG
jgi:hypothetical protein